MTTALLEKVRDHHHTQVVKIESLSSSLAVLEDVTPKIVGGHVSVQKTIEGRRTFELIAANRDGELTPRSFADPYELTRRVRIYKGVVLPGGVVEYVPLGTFQVTRSRPRERAGEHVLYVAGMDLWFPLMTTRLRTILSFAPSTTLKTILTTSLALAGITSHAIDPEADTITLPASPLAGVQWNIGTPIATVVSQILGDFGWAEPWFDVLGVFTARAGHRVDTTVPVYAISDQHACITGIDTLSEDSPELANDIIVASTSPDVAPFQVEVQDNADGSFTRADGPFGRRVTLIADSGIETAAQATDVGHEELRARGYRAKPTEVVGAPLIWLDAGDVVSLTSTRAGLDAARAYVDSMQIPLEPGEMSMRCLMLRDIGSVA